MSFDKKLSLKMINMFTKKIDKFSAAKQGRAVKQLKKIRKNAGKKYSEAIDLEKKSKGIRRTSRINRIVNNRGRGVRFIRKNGRIVPIIINQKK